MVISRYTYLVGVSKYDKWWDHPPSQQTNRNSSDRIHTHSLSRERECDQILMENRWSKNCRKFKHIFGPKLQKFVRRIIRNYLWKWWSELWKKWKNLEYFETLDRVKTQWSILYSSCSKFRTFWKKILWHLKVQILNNFFAIRDKSKLVSFKQK